MGKYKLTNLAVRDLSNIWNYTFDNWSEEQADTYHEQLINAFESIAVNQQLGRNYEGIRRDLFGFKVNRHIVFYRLISDEQVEITRILHDRMDLKNRPK
ncbi:type II toxin-antitoxin system RelE/ParE family toxin [Reichenbachiella agariperforans]|uniref:type II toxin-antitoxin system RelE/ParE family toxin n=1 Tax=Reichenbachiella agariperforans TaxID=156994 RepID=UPI001C0977BB|nr:type II toxin-antitoxin system RelE/ParE family toxin [Reichenbachiella agariperforans]MBU2912914.1 type II toxin-antitoxin system RelE/ParE family toxin [Reichenbachiella agariperforans]